ncbi:hypothetical protein [Streptomyces lushanensis]|uniref:hypothetical protein n=1 Tax=Streptomyces lushanensis TaxID=1434255 RepID=UPI0008316447|nr:hypothetical protein [Streptomyces lushanensis]
MSWGGTTRTRTTAAAVTTALLLTALTACSDSGSDTAQPAETTPAAETTTEEPTPTPAAPLTIGTPYAWEDTANGLQGTSTVLGYEQGVRSVASASEEIGAAGYEWAALELKVCSDAGSFPVTTTPWTLAYADGARIEPSSTYDDFPKPEFPFDATVTAGKCIRGKVVYPVPDDSRPESVVYAPEGLAEPVEWTVPAK